MPNFDYTWFYALTAVLAVWLLIDASRKRPRSVLGDLAVLFVAAVALSRILTLVGLKWFPGFFDYKSVPGLRDTPLAALSLPNVEIFVSAILLLLCFLDVPVTLLHQASETTRHKLWWYRLSALLVFSVIYAWHYMQFSSGVFQHNIWLTISVVAGIGVGGALAAMLVFPAGVNSSVLASRLPTWVSPRLVWAIALLIGAFALPFLKLSDGVLAYGLTYNSFEGPVKKENMQIDTYFNLAGYYQSRGETAKALAIYSETIAQQPDNYNAYLHRADLLMQTNQYQLALTDLDAATAITPTYTQPYYGRVLVHEALGNYQSAIQELSQIIALTPNDDLPYLARAAFSIYTQDYEQVLADAKRTQESYRRSEVGVILSSVAYTGQQDATNVHEVLANSTTQWFESGLDLSAYVPSYESIPISLTLFMRNLGGTNANNTLITVTVPFLENLLSTNREYYTDILILPAITSQYPYFATLLDNRFSSSAAVLDYVTPALKDLTNTTPSHALLAYNTLGALYTAEDRNTAASEYYEQALALALPPTASDDDRAELYYNLAVLNLKEGDQEKALIYFTEALTLNPHHVNALSARTQLYYELNQVEEAFNDARSLVILTPDDAEAQLQLAHYANLTGRFDSVLTILPNFAAKLDTRPFYHHCLGYAYVATGDRGQAILAYTRVLLLAENLSSSDKTRLFTQIVDEVRDLETRMPAASSTTAEIMQMLGVAIELTPPALSFTVQPTSYYRVAAAQPVTLAAGIVATTPIVLNIVTPMTRVAYLQLAAVGPDHIAPGSSEAFHIVVELRETPNPDGVAFPVELYIDHTYAVEVRPRILNFEVAGETDPAALTYPLAVGEMAEWQWVLSPRSGYEGNQSITYDIILHDQDDPTQPHRFPAPSITISVPTRYGISAQVVYPISGLGAALAAFLGLPVLNSFFTEHVQQLFKKKEEKASGVIIVPSSSSHKNPNDMPSKLPK